jgi:hypothetical protein
VILLATATKKGSVTVTFSADPVIIVQAAPPVSSPPSGGAPESAASAPVVKAPKSISFVGFKPNSWQLTKALKSAIDKFFKKIATPTKVSCVGNTMGPKVLKSYQKIAKKRGEVVCDYIANKFAQKAKIVISGVTTTYLDTRYRRTKVGLSY